MGHFYDILRGTAGEPGPMESPGGAKPGFPSANHSDEEAALSSSLLSVPECAADGPDNVCEVKDERLHEPEPHRPPPRFKIQFDVKAPLIPHAADPIVVEHYRRLRTKLLREYETNPYRLLLVASPNPREGKTVTALNIALSFSMLNDRKILVVDGDLRKGSLGKWLAVDGRPGLSDLLEGTASLDEVLLKCDGFPIHVLLRGTSKVSPGELLNSADLRRQLLRIAEQFDLVVLDSPPLNLVTDAQLLAPCCDAVIVVARAFSTTRKSFEKAVQDLEPFRVIGAVLNGGGNGQVYKRYDHYY